MKVIRDAQVFLRKLNIHYCKRSSTVTVAYTICHLSNLHSILTAGFTSTSHFFNGFDSWMLLCSCKAHDGYHEKVVI